jgi:hypothetical protein
VSAGWAACKAGPNEQSPIDAGLPLRTDQAGNVLICNRRGEYVAVTVEALPLLAIKLAEAWGAGLRPEVPDGQRIKAAQDVAAAWDRAL